MSPRSYPRQASYLPSTGRSPASADEIFGLKYRAWHQLGLIFVDPSDVEDPFDRQHLINVATRLYGPRQKGAA